ncbi:gluconokinase [Solirhodobacter olei]|uniref:gluconokinase n=1 Tax=Solirhodobacter olei TaxID=2493082 RepID=UPI000FDAB168|nr:gluconokinase [Solirhodobacter olei]
MLNRGILVMGVCGVGKSTVARAIADRIGGRFLEADEFHSVANVRAMSRGTPLTDEMRADWLDAIGGAARACREQGEAPVVLACSALKRRYRDKLAGALSPMFVVHLTGDPALIRNRLIARKNHFMPPELLDSQLHDLEPLAADEGGVTVDIAASAEEIAARVVTLIERGETDGTELHP